jgi:DNA repair protein RecN (Recombination protein N)
LEEGQRLEELAQLASGKSAKEALAFAESLLVEAATRRDVVAKIQAKNTKGSNGDTAKKGKRKA